MLKNAETFYGVNPAHAKRLVASFTKRKRQVLGLWARGMTQDEIAKELGIAKLTVTDHLKWMVKNAGIRSRCLTNLWYAAHYEPNLMLVVPAY